MRRPILLTPGMGIGPEVTVKALLKTGDHSDVVLVGRTATVQAEAARQGLRVVSIAHPFAAAPSGAVALFDPGDEAEPTEVAAIRFAASACLAGDAAALVTGPIHKKRLIERGFAFNGHTDFLEHLCGSRRAVMAFVGGELRVALVTTHVPLMQVGSLLKKDDLVRVVEIVAEALQRDLGLEGARIAVCGLNPHAGEEGALGREEIETIGPACDALRAAGHTLHGPISAETAFLGARNSRYDVVIAMYHDQGLAPLKAVDFGRSVNWTLGLPMVRTSVDHGTADALVGKDCADPASMQAALRLARTIVARRNR